MAAISESPLFSSLAKAFEDILSKDVERAVEDKKKKKKAKKSKKDDKTEEKKPQREVEEKQVVREGANSLITYPNASAFSVFSHIRHFVLQNQLCSTFNSRLVLGKPDGSDSEDEEDKEATKKEEAGKLPVMVGLGVKGVFIIIREIRNSHPELCLKTLSEFSNILCELSPAALKNEPKETTDSLFELLMDMILESAESEDPVCVQLASVVSSCLISLVVALGDTGKILAALAAMLTAPGSLTTIAVKIPQIVYSLQNSVQAVLLGGVVESNWANQGVPSKSLMETWSLSSDIPSVGGSGCVQPSIAGDGSHLYLQGSCGLLKIGSGYGNTERGKVYQHNPSFMPETVGWIGFTSGKLLFFPLGGDSIHRINADSLALEDTLELEVDSVGPTCMFSDSEGLGQILAKKEGGFVLRRLSTLCSPVPCVEEKPLQLSQKSLLGMGRVKHDPQETQHTIYQDSTEEVVRVLASKGFTAIQTASGKLLYSGSGAVFGIAEKDVPKGEWKVVDLPDKNVKVEHCSCDNNGSCSLVISDKGVAYFGGINKKGEAGEAAPRQPKPAKLKRIAKVKDYHIINGACGGGSNNCCLICKEGKVFMFGPTDGDIVDKTTGVLTDLLGVPASQVAMGRSHVCVLAQNGGVYTFGSNQYGQCGRDFVAQGIGNEEDQEEESDSDDDLNMCAPGEHQWERQVCMICKACSYCTGYGPSCCNQGQPNRVPGSDCGCGSGDSGCKVCGCCRVCSEDKDMWEGMFQVEAEDMDMVEAVRERARKRRENKVKKQRKLDRENSMGLHLLFGGGEKAEKEIGSSEGEEASSVASKAGASAEPVVSTKGPKMISLPDDLTAMQVDCGTFHSAVLLHTGEVYTFGNDNHGQLGQGGGKNKFSAVPVKVSLPESAVQVACGDNHTVVLLADGQVFAFGKCQEGQLGHCMRAKDTINWHMAPRPVPGFDESCRATWIGAQGNQTFIAVDEMLVSENSLSQYQVFSNTQMLGLVPPPSKNSRKANFVVIDTTTGKAKKFDDDEQQDLCGCGLHMNQEYNLLWTFNPQDNYFSCFNPLAAAIQDCAGTILSSSVCLPQSKEAATSCSHLATNLLSCLSTLATSPPLTVDALAGTAQKFDKDSFSCVVRFNAHGGGWGYSASSVEAIRFCSDADVLLGGFGLYGGRGTYNADLKVYDLGLSGGDSETDGTLLTSQTESGYSCEKQQTYRVLFDKPVLLQADHWYAVCAYLTSPTGSSSDAGSSGQSEVVGNDKVSFRIKSSKRSNNGTDVGSGQIPEILYRIPTMETDSVLQVQLLDKSFSTTVSASGLDAVLKLLEWSWSLLTVGRHSSPPVMSGDAHHLAFVSRSCLLLLRTYIQEAYPKQQQQQLLQQGKSKQSRDTLELAEMVHKAQLLLRHILSTRSNPAQEKGEEPLGIVMEACCSAFRMCFHAFYPTTPLKWLCLCQHLQLLDPNDVVSGAPMENLLCAVLDALAEPEVSYIGLGYDKTISIRAAIFNSEPDSVFPILSDYMQMKVLEENGDGELLSFSLVATKLLSVVTAPVRSALVTRQAQMLESPVVSKAGILLQSRINELALCISYPESAAMSGLPVLRSEKKEKVLESSVRFSTKEAGHPSLTVNGVSFSVSKKILLQGVTVYAGMNHSYNYKVNVFEGSRVVTSCEGTFHESECYGNENRYVNIVFKHSAKLEPEVVYLARVQMEGTSFSIGVDGSTSFTGPGDVAFSLHSMASEDCKSDVGPLVKFLYSLPSSSGPQSVLQMSVHLSSTLLGVTVSFLQRAISENLSLDVLNLLGSSFLFSTLLPTTLAQLGPVACKHPKFAVEVLDLVKDSLPVASAAAKLASSLFPYRTSLNVIDTGGDGGEASTSAEIEPRPVPSDAVGLHYATVETEHPYKQAAVSHFKVKFNDKVQWMSLEFDSKTGFAQKEDRIGDLLIPRCVPISSSPTISASSSSSSSTTATAPSSTVLSSSSLQTNRSSSEHVQQLMGVGLEDLYADWERYSLDYPRGLVLLPGNEVHIVVNADTEYEKRDNMNHYGMKCQVVGYEWTNRPNNCLLFLEKELSTLGSMCAASLLKKDTVIPFAEELTVSSKDSEKADMRIVQAAAEEVLKNHGHVLGRGLMVECPTIQHILTGNISVITDSNEQKFLHDFIESKVDTAGGRLACWLQPDRAVNPKASELIIPSEPIKTGVSSIFTVNTRDQDGKLVHVAGMKVEVKAVWMGKKEEGQKSLRDKMVDSVMGVRKPTFKRSYNPTRLNSNYLFHSMTMMMAYSDYSFEELRLFAPKVEKSSESMPLKSNKDGSYTANWVPSVGGEYVIHIFIDSCNTGKEYPVEVAEPDLEEEEETGVEEEKVEKSSTEDVPDKDEEEEVEDVDKNGPKMKEFKGGSVRGVRIRASPSFTAEAFGVVKQGDFFTYEEEFENEAGRWVKMTPEAMFKLGCKTSATEAYVLSFNKEKDMLLLEEKEVPKQVRSAVKKLSPSGGGGSYLVVHCGAAGHNIRSKPGIKGTPVGRLTKGNRVEASEEAENDDGIWLKLTKDTATKYCSSDVEAWTLAVGLSGRVFLAAEGDESYLAQVAESKTSEATKAASMFPTAASVFGTPQQSVFGSSMTPATFQFPSSKPVKLKFGSQDGSSQGATEDSSKPFTFGSTSSEDDKSGGEKDKALDTSPQKQPSGKAVPKAGRLSGKANQQKNKPVFPLMSQSSNESSQDVKDKETSQDVKDKETSQDVKDKDGSEEAICSESDSLPNDKDERVAKEDTPPESQKSSGHTQPLQCARQALSPAVAECQRAVFAAFLWQESLVHDAMASATYLKFHPELTKEFRQVIEREGLKRYESEESSMSDKDMSVVTESDGEKLNDVFQPILPPTLGHLVTLWDEISTKVLNNSSMTLPVPKVPALAQELQNRYEAEKKELEKRKKDKDKKVVSPPGGGSTMCELCEQSYLDPVTYHMKDIHPGCGKHANGWGYNSRGTYCSGWAGNCGDGGRGGSTWYLLCKDCHARYIALKDDVRKKAVKAVVLPKVKTRKPGKPRSLPVLTAVQGMIMNAKFLLEIARFSEGVPTTPQVKSPSVTELVAPELLRQVSSPLDSTTPSSVGPSTHGPSPLTKSDSLPHEPSSSGVSVIEYKLLEQVKRPSYLRSISEAFKTEPAVRALSGVSQSPDDSKVFRMPGREELKTLVLDNTSSSSLMVKPSKNLRQLIYRRSRSSPENKDMGYRRVMEFVLRHHDLDGLRVSMKQSMRVAGIRAFAMEFLEWLLTKVHEPSVVHDILWQFNCSLSVHPVASKRKDKNEEKKELEDDAEGKLPNQHPLAGLDGAGIMLQFLRKQFHSFLKTTSNIMPKLPAGSAVQQEAMQCYYMQFQSQDHSFLLQSNVFSNISKALSIPEEQQGEGSKACKDKELEACMMEDVLAQGKLKVSSNEAMSNSLTDSSTETFWESRDEPRSKPKMITITFDGAGNTVFGVAVHIDNQKDAGQRVEKLTLWVGKDEDSLKEVAKAYLSMMHIGWKTLVVPPQESTHVSVARVQVDGHQNKIRVRQVQVLAPPTKSADYFYPAAVAQQKSCEAEALRVFRSLTSQVFGGLLSAKPEVSRDETDSAPSVEVGDKDGGKEGGVREHMVGILFTKGFLSGLQKQVCLHIIQSVHTEMLRMKEEWEVACSKAPSKPAKQAPSEPSTTGNIPEDQVSDNYCYELLSMLLGLSQSEVGCGYLSEQSKLVEDLFTLLHVGSNRIQLRVCFLLRKILPVVGPKGLAPMLHVRILPPLGYSAIAEAVNSAATINQLGLLDCLLAIISKALSVQVKAKGRSSNILNVLTGASNWTALTLANLVNPKVVPGETTIKPQRWYLKGGVSKAVAGEVVKLLKDMIQGSLGPQWEGYSKSTVGQAVLHLTKINEEARMPVPGMYSQTLWLCLAALCVIDKEHAEALSSGQWLGQDGKPKSKPLCDNHDDGESEALILCNHCGNLCGECDRVLHYSRKNKDHQRQIFKEEEEAVKVELHEGCGRIKLYWTMALADYRTLKGLIEFKESGSGGGKGACRFCGTTGGTSLQSIGYVCSDPECMHRSDNVCDKTLPCGHACSGVSGEDSCLPCLHQGCATDGDRLKQDADDMCMICYTEGLSCAPCIQLECGHVFHYQCCRNNLTKRWSGPRITFRFLFCSICVNTRIGHPNLGDVLGPITDLYDDVKKKCMMRMEYENQMKCDALTNPSSKFHQKPLEYAMWKYAYYVCFKCSKSYYGGDANCAEQVSASDEYDSSELVCPQCSNVGGPIQDCPKHGVDFLEYKCRYCCSVAVYFCFGTTHFCNPCHDDFQRLTSIPKAELPQCPVGPCAKPLEGTECPLHVKHPPTGEEFALGCGVCRNAQTF